MSVRFLGIMYDVAEDNKCYFNNTYIPLIIERLADGTIDSATAHFDMIKNNIDPELYEELGFAHKEICPRHGKLSSCWQLNR
jgi:hypothetical protein